MIGFQDKRRNPAPPARREPSLDKALDAQTRRELARAVSAIADERRNAALVAADAEALDLHGQLLVGALRQRGSLQVELYLPSSTEALIGRFNALLADIPLEQARRVGTPDGPLRVWVVHAGRHSEWRDTRLLLRLVAEFPGTRVRALLLLESSVDAGLQLDALGPRLHRWAIGPQPSALPPDDAPQPSPAALELPRHEPALPTGSSGEADPSWHHRIWAERNARLAQLVGQRPSATPRPALLRTADAADAADAAAEPGGDTAAGWLARSSGALRRAAVWRADRFTARVRSWLSARLFDWTRRPVRLARGLRARLRPAA